MRIPKICEFCKQEFIARKTTSACCSNDCAKRYYKQRKREEKIQNARMDSKSKKIISSVNVEELKIINTKRFLTLKEAALVFNVSPLTLRRWLLDKKIETFKIGKKWMFESDVITGLARF